MMKSTIILSAFASLAAAQVQILMFGTNELPTCAETCQTLLNAQTVCVPPSAPVTNAQTYKSCFCQSGYLNTLDTDASTICSTTCTSQTDRTQIQSWYKSYCADASELPSGTATGASSTSASSTATATSATGTGTSTSATASSTATATGTTTTSANTNPTWWDTHARWIAMVIVLIVGFGLLTALLLWLRRRYRRKHYGLGSGAEPVVWGPHQNQHATGGVEYNGAPAVAPLAAYSEKGKGPVAVGAHAPMAYNQPRPVARQDPEKGGKLKKLLGRD